MNTSTINNNVIVLANAEALAQDAARRFVALAQIAISSQGHFSVALSGGSTPKRMHELLAQPPLRDEVDWHKVHIFFGDERFLKPDDPDSNYFMAQETLLAKVLIPTSNIHPFPTVDMTPEEAAKQYTKTLQTFFGLYPAFDLILLGMGPDGHTASLFPDFPQVTHPPDTFVEAVSDAPKPPPTRLTLTYKTINLAKNVLLLVGGSSKADALYSIFQDKQALPAGKVQPVNGTLLWLLDKAAARGLERD